MGALGAPVQERSRGWKGSKPVLGKQGGRLVLCFLPQRWSTPLFFQGSLKHVSGIFFMLYNTGLKPTVESYAMALECMGRVSCAPKKIQQ